MDADGNPMDPHGKPTANRTPNQEGGQDTPPPTPPSRSGSDSAQHLSSRGLLIVFTSLAVALVLGYLLLNKLVDMSQEEDCALAHRYNCGAVEVPR